MNTEKTFALVDGGTFKEVETVTTEKETHYQMDALYEQRKALIENHATALADIDEKIAKGIELGARKKEE